MNSKVVKGIVHILNGMLIIGISLFIGFTIYNEGFPLNIINTTQIVFAVILLVIITYGLAYRVKRPESILELEKHIEKWKCKPSFEEKNKKAEKLAMEYYFNSSLALIVSIVIIAIVGLAAFAQIFHTISKSGIFMTWVILLSIPIVRTMVSYKNNMKICNILYNNCDPYTCVIAFYKIMSFPRGKQFQIRDSYKLLVSNMLYFTGDFQFTLKFIDMMDKEYKKKNKMNFLFQSDYIKFLCFINMDKLEEAKGIKDSIEEKVKNNPKLKRNKIIKSILPKMENNFEFINGNYEKSKELTERNLVFSSGEHQRVSSQYRLFQIDTILGNEEAAKERKEYILNHGNELFYVSKCK